MNKKSRVVVALVAAAIVIGIGIAVELQTIAEPLAVLIPIITAGQVVAIVAFFLTKKKGYDGITAFYIAVSIFLFTAFTGIVAGLVEFSRETGNISRGAFHIMELALIIIAVVYLISGMKRERAIA